MREDLFEALGEGISLEQEEALLATPEYADYICGELEIGEFRTASAKYLRAMKKSGGDWRDGYYEALSLSMCSKINSTSWLASARAPIPQGLLSSPSEIDAWIEAQATSDADTASITDKPSIARISVRAWEYEREFVWRSRASPLGVLATLGEKLRRFGWKAEEARGYILTGQAPTFLRALGKLTFDTREFPGPRIKLSLDPSASPEEVLAAFSAQKARLGKRVRPFVERRLELYKHTIPLPQSSGEWKDSMKAWNERSPDAGWRYIGLKEYKAAARRVNKGLRNRAFADDGRYPDNRRIYLGW